jgi:hypothetical protein
MHGADRGVEVWRASWRAIRKVDHFGGWKYSHTTTPILDLMPVTTQMVGATLSKST